MRRVLLLLLLVPCAAFGQCTFSPAGGVYTTPQTVTVNCPAGLTAFYTTDGSTPSLAGYQYTTPIVVSATSTLKIIAAQMGVTSRNTGNSSSFWKCGVPSAHNYAPSGPNCGTAGGVGTINPSAVTWAFGSPMVETTSTTSSTGTTQILYINTQSSSACKTCTGLVEDKIVGTTTGSTKMLNQEMDANINMLSTYNQFHTASLQCNQQAGKLQWQIDNQQGSWVNTGITYGCPLSLTQQTEVRYGIHWTNGDTSCGGFSCDSYDFLTVCVGGTNGTGGVCHDFNLGPKILSGYTEPSFSQSMVIQDQHDLTNTTTSGQNPTTGNRSVWNNNVTTYFYGTQVTSSATYTIVASVPPAVKFRGQLALKGNQQWQ